MHPSTDPQVDILVVARWGRDAELITRALDAAGIASRVAGSVVEAANDILDKADILIVVEEVLDTLAVQALEAALHRQRCVV